jgi:hypothetical protein
VTGNYFIQTGRRFGFLTLMTLAGFLSTGENALGQEALRISTAGDIAEEQQKQAESTIGYYNLLTGPVAWRFSSGLEMDYNDNINLQATNAQSDFIFRPNVDTQMHWPVTQVNDLNVSLAAGYSAYLQHGNLNDFFINPGSGIFFKIYAGDFVINVHDQVSTTEDAYQNQSANGNAIYTTLQNTAGVGVLWDVNKAVVTLGYDHGNYLTLNSVQVQSSAVSENFSLSGGVRPVPEALAGLEAGYGLDHFSGGDATPDAIQWNLGGFCTATISKYLDVRLDAGYTEFLPDTTTTNFNSGVSSGLYVQFLLTHRVNRFLSYTLSAGRSIDLKYNSHPYDRITARWQPDWTFLNNYSISTPMWWEHGTEIYLGTTTYDQYGAGITIGRQITQKLSGILSYQYIKETSDEADLNYTDQIVSLSFSYQF